LTPIADALAGVLARSPVSFAGDVRLVRHT
jgi:hypothetical protein